MPLKILTLDDLRKSKPCYDPTKYLPEGWTGTLVDMLDTYDCPPGDRLYVARKCLQLSDKVLRLFAVKCARLAQTYPKNYTPDPHTLIAIDTAERFAYGNATREELSIARSDAAAAADAAYAYAYAYAAAAAADAAYADATAGATYAAAAAAADAAYADAYAYAAAADAAAADAYAYAYAAAAAAYAARKQCQLQLVAELRQLIIEDSQEQDGELT